MASDPDPLASAGSRCILDFGTHKEICKGEIQEDMANHALHTLQRLARNIHEGSLRKRADVKRDGHLEP